MSIRTVEPRWIGGPTVRKAGRVGDMRDTLADRTQAERILGWHPKVSIEEGIADLLKREPSLKLLVVGHTDNVGDFESNRNLSQRRAESVANALV